VATEARVARGEEEADSGEMAGEGAEIEAVAEDSGEATGAEAEGEALEGAGAGAETAPSKFIRWSPLFQIQPGACVY
jgi:hypothetical protein